MMQKNFLCFLFVAVLSAVFLCTPAYAVPMLQLDIEDGIYSAGLETVIATDPDFTLYALLQDKKGKYVGSEDFYISAALIPIVENPADPTGSFIFDGQQVVVDRLEFSSPLGMDPHGVFPTYYWESAPFVFKSSNAVNEYDTAESPGGPSFGDDLGKKIVYYEAFSVDTSLLGADWAVHFDVYNKTDNPGEVDKRNPDSHSAMSPVPEPATMLLLGSGLIGLAAVGRRRFRKS